jgi:phosphatidate phosphatase APP1
MQLDPPFEAPPRWHEVALWLPDLDQSGEATITGRVIGPFPGAAFGVISDIDETVIQTGIDDLIKLAHNTFVVNAYKRLPFPGVREFYMALRRGISGEGFNPIFYVSNAPWNLYDLIQDVFRIRDIPLGPFFLVGWGLEDTHLFRASPFEHKLGSIDQIMDAYPHLDFILLGDNTEKDPEIYLEAVRRHPHRIKVVYVYLRGQPSSQSESHLEQIGARVREAGSDFVSVRSVVEAASDAASRGLIQPSTIESVKQAYEKES